jgi:hypothetical protein
MSLLDDAVTIDFGQQGRRVQNYEHSNRPDTMLELGIPQISRDAMDVTAQEPEIKENVFGDMWQRAALYLDVIDLPHGFFAQDGDTTE